MSVTQSTTTGKKYTEAEFITSVVQPSLDTIDADVTTAQAAADAAQASADTAQSTADAATDALEGTQTGGGAAQYVFSVALPATVDGTYNFTLAPKVARSQNYRIVKITLVTHSGLGSNAGTQNLTLEKGDGDVSEAFTAITTLVELHATGNNAMVDIISDGGGNFSTDTGDHYFPYSVIESGKSLRAHLVISGRTDGLTTRAYVHVLTSPEPTP